MKTTIVSVSKNIRYLLVPYLIILASCLGIAAIYSKDDIYFAVNTRHFALGDTFFTLWTNMGDGLVCVIISVALLLINYRKGFLMATSYIVTSLVAQVLKHIFVTPRPVIYFENQISRIYLVKGVEMLETLSFPSGHSVSAFSAAAVLTYITPKKAWGLLFLILAILVGYSRMYLSEHFFEDVVGGSALGVFITLFWITWLDGKPFLHTPKWNRGLIRTRPLK